MTNDKPVLEPQNPPAHRDGFWAELEESMASAVDGESVISGGGEITTELARTQPIPQVGRRVAPLRPEPRPLADAEGGAPTSVPAHQKFDELADRRNRRVWPIAAAAAVLALVGFGFLLTRTPADSGLRAELVAGDDAEAVIPLDGPEGNDSAEDATAESADPVDLVDPVEPAAAQPGAPATNAEPEAQDDVAAQTEQTVALPVILAAPGAAGTPTYLPTDGAVPDGSTFLGNWPTSALTWFSTTKDGTSCTDPKHSQIRSVSTGGSTQPVHDPELSFSGVISHVAINEDSSRAAWLVSCEAQLEFYVAEIESLGQLSNVSLVWFGNAQTSNVVVQVDQSTANLNAFDLDGTPFFIEFDLATREVNRDGRATFVQQESVTASRSSLPAAVSADNTVSYWPGTLAADQDPCSQNPGSAGSLWLRSTRNTADAAWLQITIENYELGQITAAAIDEESSRVAFADGCPGAPGRVFVASQRGDGTLTDVFVIDLDGRVPGFADALFWVDSETLRIETNNTEYDIDQVRYDFLLDEGKNSGVFRLLN